MECITQSHTETRKLTRDHGGREREREREGTIERRMIGAIKGEREKWVGLKQYRAESIGVQ